MTNWRRDSVVSEITRTTDDLPTIVAKLNSPSCFCSKDDTLYPFSQVLRLRVLQIVCGISILIMGAVACIENGYAITSLGLGVPAGVVTVLAAAANIHTSRGFGGYQPSSCRTSSLRFLGPNPHIACPLSTLWSGACFLHTAVMTQATFILRSFENYRHNHTAFLLALIEMILSLTTIAALVWIIRIDLCYDPD